MDQQETNLIWEGKETAYPRLIKVSQQLRGSNFHKTDKICFEVVCEGNIPYSGDFSSKHAKTAMNHAEALNMFDLIFSLLYTCGFLGLSQTRSGALFIAKIAVSTPWDLVW